MYSSLNANYHVTTTPIFFSNQVTGEQSSAEGLTWSYANILHALKERTNAAKMRKEVLGF